MTNSSALPTRFVVAVILGLLFTGCLIESLEWRHPASLMPRVAAIVGIVACVVEIATTVLARRAAASRATPGVDPMIAGDSTDASATVKVDDEIIDASLGQVASAVLWPLLLLAAIVLLGFSLGGACIAFLYNKVGARSSWTRAILVAAAIGLLIEWGFVWALAVPLPLGVLLGG